MTPTDLISTLQSSATQAEIIDKINEIILLIAPREDCIIFAIILLIQFKCHNRHAGQAALKRPQLKPL